MGVIVQAERMWLGPGRIEEGWGLRTENGKIQDVGPVRKLRQGRPLGETVLDCGRTLLMPGLVNAHVHLELGWLRDRTNARLGFASWVRDLRRFQIEDEAAMGKDEFRHAMVQAIRLGAIEMLHHGTTTFLDVSNTGLPGEILPGNGPRSLAALECLGLDRRKAASVLERAEAYLEAGPRGRISPLAVPHALYSCSGPLLKGMGALAGRQGFTSIHMVESSEEADLYQLGMGKLKGFVDEICPDHDILVGEDPLERFERFVGQVPSFLAVHGYALSPGQVQRLSRMGAAVCLCPSSRGFFLHPSIPLADLARHKIPVCLGTDSLASAPTLSLWREMAVLHQEHPDLDPGRILSWATEGGARALGVPAGRLQAGLSADWIAVETADVPDDDLESFLVDEEPDVRVVCVEGEILLDGRWEG
ncbi:MAG TPA: amidohydrolase family protein [Fibrobacteria bacterium]|nr:amidohydrolase family protein [Fibrobacteria bacterium]